MSSPHTRGCFLISFVFHCFCCVFPAHTGVFPAFPFSFLLRRRLPRTHGGVSRFICGKCSLLGSSPHTRGCFQSSLNSTIILVVFPAHTGVFLYYLRFHHIAYCLPRTHGGVSFDLEEYKKEKRSSPHTRGCFCF